MDLTTESPLPVENVVNYISATTSRMVQLSTGLSIQWMQEAIPKMLSFQCKHTNSELLNPRSFAARCLSTGPAVLYADDLLFQTSASVVSVRQLKDKMLQYWLYAGVPWQQDWLNSWSERRDCCHHRYCHKLESRHDIFPVHITSPSVDGDYSSLWHIQQKDNDKP